jgi:hypothetical protein
MLTDLIKGCAMSSNVIRILKSLGREEVFEASLDQLGGQVRRAMRDNPNFRVMDIVELVKKNPELEKRLADSYAAFLKGSQDEAKQLGLPLKEARVKADFVKDIVGAIPNSLKGTEAELRDAFRQASDLMQIASGAPRPGVSVRTASSTPTVENVAKRSPDDKKIDSLRIGEDRIPQTAKFDVLKTFDEIEDILENRGLLKPSLDRGTRTELTGLKKNTPKEVPNVLSPKDIFDEMTANRPISVDELKRLRTFFKENGFDTTARPSTQESFQNSGVGTKWYDTLLRAGPKIKDWMASAANSRLWADQGTISRNLYALYSDGAKPGVLSFPPTRWVNGIREGSVRALGASALALSTGYMTPGYINPESASNIQMSLYDLSQPNGGVFGLGTHPNPLVAGQREFIQLMFDRYTSQGGRVPIIGVAFDTFEQAVERFVSPELYAELTKDKKFTADPETIGKIAAYMGDKNARISLDENSEGYIAFRLACAHFLKISKPEDAEWKRMGDISNEQRVGALTLRMTVGQGADETLLSSLRKISGLPVPDLSPETVYNVAVQLAQNRRSKDSTSDFAEFGAAIQVMSSYFGHDAKEGDDKDPYKMLSGLINHLEIRSAEAYALKFIGTSVGNSDAFVEATNRITGVSIDAFKGDNKPIPAEKLLEIAIALQNSSSSTNKREINGFSKALMNKINPNLNIDLNEKTATGQDVKSLRERAVDEAYALNVRVLSNSASKTADFLKQTLNVTSLPSSPDEQQIMALKKLRDFSFARTKEGTILSLLYLSKKPSEIGKEGDWTATVNDRITSIENSVATQQQAAVAAGAQTAADQEAARGSAAALKLQQSINGRERSEAVKVDGIRKSFSEVAALVPGLKGKEKEILAAFDTVSASGAFNRATSGSDPYTVFATELQKRGIPERNIPDLVDHVRNFRPN